MNPARKDDLQLKHWVRIEEKDVEAYPFAKFGQAVPMVDYTDEEYQAHLEGTPRINSDSLKRHQYCVF